MDLLSFASFHFKRWIATDWLLLLIDILREIKWNHIQFFFDQFVLFLWIWITMCVHCTVLENILLFFREIYFIVFIVTGKNRVTYILEFVNHHIYSRISWNQTYYYWLYELFSQDILQARVHLRSFTVQHQEYSTKVKWKTDWTKFWTIAQGNHSTYHYSPSFG